ncbi:PREDICTED: uncharacterized protein LOC109216864 [Nicotiana attenuata]|uniref:uncharacterized protein LOC109216864 n=1 Tax=Nicotiana attenuata TaxID=49451 RepID=UPI000904A5ED|nr:PREDICTED: uncharacterized protein LOC109216864 [Nicotiana attenuata]
MCQKDWTHPGFILHEIILSSRDCISIRVTSCSYIAYHLNRPDRMQDNSVNDKINHVKGAMCFLTLLSQFHQLMLKRVQTAHIIACTIHLLCWCNLTGLSGAIWLLFLVRKSC